MYSIEVQRRRHVRLQELGIGLDAQAVDAWLRQQVTSAGVFGLSVDLVAGRLNSTRPRVRRAIEALCGGTRGDDDDRPLLVHDARACVAYFPGQPDDLSPLTADNARKRISWIGANFPRCAPVELAIDEHLQWGAAHTARQEPQQGRLALVGSKRRVQE